MSPESRVRVRGPIACFTRPELKAERVSYPLMTPSAARGILEAILWKPAIRWRIDRIKVLNPIRWIAFRRNEVASRASPPAAAVIDTGGVAPVLIVEDDRAQRNTVALRDVDYVIEAHFEITERAGPEENTKKFTEMFERRLEKGQHFHQPYLGCREFVAEVGPVNGDVPSPIDHSQDLGLMLWDIDFGKERNRPRFFQARLEHGVLEVPADPETTFASHKELSR
ncbi:MAG: type I-C CRISPR-associated protein Cas5c [Pirellulales bacterium]